MQENISTVCVSLMNKFKKSHINEYLDKNISHQLLSKLYLNNVHCSIVFLCGKNICEIILPCCNLGLFEF